MLTFVPQKGRVKDSDSTMLEAEKLVNSIVLSTKCITLPALSEHVSLHQLQIVL